MDSGLYNQFVQLIYARTGISLSDNKQLLISSRIAKRIRSLCLKGEQEYFDFITHQENGDELYHFIDAISTNVTGFFREPDHFHRLEELIDILLTREMREIRIWCAASSSGEEPYTIAMTVKEKLGKNSHLVKILATDISRAILKKASAGIYTADKLAAVPKAFVDKYFSKLNTHDSYAIKPEIRDMIVFRELNLSEIPLPLKGPLDIIFCRNVMIYFDQPVKQALVDEFDRLLGAGGTLIISHTESLGGIQNNFKVMQASVYVKPYHMGRR